MGNGRDLISRRIKRRGGGEERSAKHSTHTGSQAKGGDTISFSSSSSSSVDVFSRATWSQGRTRFAKCTSRRREGKRNEREGERQKGRGEKRDLADVSANLATETEGENGWNGRSNGSWGLLTEIISLQRSVCRRGNDLAALFPRYPTLHSRLAGSRRPEIRLRFSADLPGQRNRGWTEEEARRRRKSWKNVGDSRSKAREAGKILRVNGSPLSTRIWLGSTKRKLLSRKLRRVRDLWITMTSRSYPFFKRRFDVAGGRDDTWCAKDQEIRIYIRFHLRFDERELSECVP